MKGLYGLLSLGSELSDQRPVLDGVILTHCAPDWDASWIHKDNALIGGKELRVTVDHHTLTPLWVLILLIVSSIFWDYIYNMPDLKSADDGLPFYWSFLNY